jgi:hypothetical protein
VDETRDRVAQFNSIAADLTAEIETLGQKRVAALQEYGRAEIEARIAGKSIALPKAVAAIDADLESRNAALAAAQSAKQEAEALLARFTDEATEIRRQLRDAFMRCAELDFYKALPALMPIIARLVVARSGLAYSGTSNTFEIQYSPSDVKAAEAALNAEIDGTADAGVVPQ